MGAERGEGGAATDAAQQLPRAGMAVVTLHHISGGHMCSSEEQ